MTASILNNIICINLQVSGNNGQDAGGGIRAVGSLTITSSTVMIVCMKGAGFRVRDQHEGYQKRQALGVGLLIRLIVWVRTNDWIASLV